MAKSGALYSCGARISERRRIPRQQGSPAYFETRGMFREQRKEIVAAMQEFWGLAAKLIKNQGSALPDFRHEIEPPLKKAFPGKTPEELESLKNYFIQN